MHNEGNASSEEGQCVISCDKSSHLCSVLLKGNFQIKNVLRKDKTDVLVEMTLL